MSRRGVWGVILTAAAAVGAFVLVRSLLRPRNAAPVGGGYFGNPESMVFHRQECRLYSPGEEVPFFRDRQSAVEQGYRPCGVCSP